MNKRIRKKQLKKLGTYVTPQECWNLDITIAKFIIPRLKYFKTHTIAYPGVEDMKTPEQWNNALDKMIKAFEACRDWDILAYTILENEENYAPELENLNSIVEEGMNLFVKYYRDLWW